MPAVSSLAVLSSCIYGCPSPMVQHSVAQFTVLTANQHGAKRQLLCIVGDSDARRRRNGTDTSGPPFISVQRANSLHGTVPPRFRGSLLPLSHRISIIEALAHLQGMSLVPAVTELVMAELLYLQYDAPSKPINLYINSTGVTVRVSPCCSRCTAVALHSQPLVTDCCTAHPQQPCHAAAKPTEQA